VSQLHLTAWPDGHLNDTHPYTAERPENSTTSVDANHDRWYRVTAPHPEGSVRTATSGRSGPSCSGGLERRTWCSSSSWREQEAFLLVTAICTRAVSIIP